MVTKTTRISAEYSATDCSCILRCLVQNPSPPAELPEYYHFIDKNTGIASLKSFVCRSASMITLHLQAPTAGCHGHHHSFKFITVFCNLKSSTQSKFGSAAPNPSRPIHCNLNPLASINKDVKKSCWVSHTFQLQVEY